MLASRQKFGSHLQEFHLTITYIKMQTHPFVQIFIGRQTIQSCLLNVLLTLLPHYKRRKVTPFKPISINRKSHELQK